MGPYEELPSKSRSGFAAVWVLALVSLIALISACRSEETTTTDDRPSDEEVAAAAAEVAEREDMGADDAAVTVVLLESAAEAEALEVEQAEADAEALREIAERTSAEAASLEKDYDTAVRDGASPKKIADLAAQLEKAKEEAKQAEVDVTEKEKKAADARARLEELLKRLGVATGLAAAPNNTCASTSTSSTSSVVLSEVCNDLELGGPPLDGQLAMGCDLGIGGGGGPGSEPNPFAVMIGRTAGTEVAAIVGGCALPGGPAGHELLEILQQRENVVIEFNEDGFYNFAIPAEDAEEIFEQREYTETILVDLVTDEDSWFSPGNLLKEAPELVAPRLTDLASVSEEFAGLDTEIKLTLAPDLLAEQGVEVLGPVSEEDLLRLRPGSRQALDVEVIETVDFGEGSEVLDTLSENQREAAGIDPLLEPSTTTTAATVETTESTDTTDQTTTTATATTEPTTSTSTTTAVPTSVSFLLPFPIPTSTGWIANGSN